jgi:HSP20 family protein
MKTSKPVLPIEDAFPALLEGMMRPRFWNEPLAPAIPLDITEADGAYLVRADIPGVKKENIFVDVDGSVVTIRAQMPGAREANVLHAERFHGITLSRTFTLPLAVDLDATTARYEDGVLFVALPKKDDAALHRVMVN